MGLAVRRRVHIYVWCSRWAVKLLAAPHGCRFCYLAQLTCTSSGPFGRSRSYSVPRTSLSTVQRVQLLTKLSAYLVGGARFELATTRLSVVGSTGLSYPPKPAQKFCGIRSRERCVRSPQNNRGSADLASLQSSLPATASNPVSPETLPDA